jgi:adenylate kinase family enzyme
VIIYLDADDSVMVERLLGRAKTSGRSDDNEETIKKRLATFHANNDAIIEAFASKSKKVWNNVTLCTLLPDKKG